MATMTRDRNYKKNPHTANWLMTFHTAGNGLPTDLDENKAERDLAAAAAAEDLLDMVPVEAPAYRPSENQRALMASLLEEIAELDADLARIGSAYTLEMSVQNAWTSENVKRWIGNLIAKKRELVAARKSAPVTVTPTGPVADGRYAVEEDGVLRFFKVKNGRRPGFVFLDIQASDEWHSIRNLGRIRSILALIAQDPKGAMVRYGQELGECGHCGRTLTDEASRAAGIGPICASK